MGGKLTVLLASLCAQMRRAGPEAHAASAIAGRAGDEPAGP